jgi:tRNA (guanine37-N1)-methyltransferase
MPAIHFHVITIFEQMFDAVTKYGINSRAFENKLYYLSTYNPRDCTTDNYHRIDDRPYGGGPGMVMLAEPLQKTLLKINDNIKSKSTLRILLSPCGKAFNHNIAKRWLHSYDNLIFVCGRYEGIDQRFIDKHIDEQCSIGDVVLSGGEIAAMLMIDSIIRLIPDAINSAASFEQDSFENSLLDHPHYTRPEVWDDIEIPDVLKSGNHANITQWRREQSLKLTMINRPELIQQARAKNLLSKKDEQYLAQL